MIARPQAVLFISLMIAASADAAKGPAYESLQNLAGNAAVPGRSVAQGEPVASERSDEQRVEDVCASRERVLIVDNFVEKDHVDPYLDVDGDGKPDVANGDAVSAIYRGTGKAVGHLTLRGDGSIANLADRLAFVAEKLERGEVKFAAVNLSLSVEVPLASVGRDLDVPYAAPQFRAHREEINQALIKMMDEHDSPEYGELSRAAAKLAARGIPIIIMAGNGGPGKVNLLGFLPGAISVGALTRAGSKSPTSPDNSLVAVWRNGQIILRRTTDGNVDVNDDGIGDFDRAKLSAEATVASRFVGQTVRQAVIPTPHGGDFDILSRETPGGIARLIEIMPDKLYRTEELIRFFQRQGDPYAELMRQQAPYYDKTMTFPFAADAKGRITFNPAKDGSAGQVGLLSGSSFAAASICAQPSR